ncbi:hypothetical protein LCGC14_1300560 [marine sediment metagenome]|uniref:Uncharacterized protein n=1 Tax=marine sediment metagenome TaxID=412755 RepID=A0A0F9KR66_9ZZZZ
MKVLRNLALPLFLTSGFALGIFLSKDSVFTTPGKIVLCLGFFAIIQIGMKIHQAYTHRRPK